MLKDFKNILLQNNQKELFYKLVETALNDPRVRENKFLIIQTFGSSTIKHSNVPSIKISSYIGDIQALANEKLLFLTYIKSNLPVFDITPYGFKYYEYLKQGNTLKNIKLIDSLIQDAKKLPDGNWEKLNSFKSRAEMIIRNLYGNNSNYLKELDDIKKYPIHLQSDSSDVKFSWNKKRKKAKILLNTIKEELELFSKDQEKNQDNFNHNGINYVDQERINELKEVISDNYDLSKLINLCEEINICSKNDCRFSIIFLTRAIIDHVPPIFGYKKFAEVSNNYSGSRSFKDSMIHLEESSRKIADQHLHCQIRSKESHPTRTQVNFRNDLDVLLAEIVRILK